MCAVYSTIIFRYILTYNVCINNERHSDDQLNAMQPFTVIEDAHISWHQLLICVLTFFFS